MFDYPALASAAALQAFTRHVAAAMGASVEAYRVLSDRSVGATLRRNGSAWSSSQRQFVLPIALHKRIDSLAVTSNVEGAARARRPPLDARIAGDRRGGALRVLVTGATGFTGGHLARALAARGHTVTALVRDPARAAGLAAHGIDLAVGDLEDRASLDRASRAVDIVYHIAAIYRQAGLPDSKYRAVNAGAVRSVIEAAAAAGARRVVHCSTVGVHGDIEHPPADEDAPLRPGDVYQVTKVEGEAVARQAAADTGMSRCHRAPDRHLRAGRPATAQAVPRRGAAPVRRCSAAGGSTITSRISTILSRGSASAERRRPRQAAPISWPAAK